MSIFGSGKPPVPPQQVPPAQPPDANRLPLTRLPSREVVAAQSAHSAVPPPPPPGAHLSPSGAYALPGAPAPAPPQAVPPTAPGGLTMVRPTAAAGVRGASELRALMAEAVQRGASDLHLTRNMPPMIRLDGSLVPLSYPPLSGEQVSKLIASILSPVQRDKFEIEWELDLSIEVADIGRFRVNVHRQRGTMEAAFRVVNDQIKPLRTLGLPPVTEDFARKNSGLVVVTGPTGSGKTTTLAAMVDQINNERPCMVITIEDPIEYVHTNKRAVIKQREIAADTQTFTKALRHALRQDPDVIVVGEMRDLETIQTALMAAETGHMIFTTLHTPDAIQTIDRIVDVFPPHQQEQTRIQLANTLQGVVAQQLLAIPGNRGRVLAFEIMLATIAVRKTIRMAKTEQLMTIIQTSSDVGMISMDKCLKNLYLQGLVTFDDAISRCKFPENFEKI